MLLSFQILIQNFALTLGYLNPALNNSALDTTFASLKRVYLNPKSNLRVRYI